MAKTSCQSRNFLFEPWWLKDEICKEVIRWVWEKEPILADVAGFARKLENVVRTLAKWGSKMYGRLPEKIKVLSQDIKALSKDNLLPSSKARIQVLGRERDKLYALEEYYWKQWANWLHEGYRNMKFSHAKASLKRQKNIVLGIDGKTITWQKGDDKVASVVVEYYEEIFSSTNPSSDVILVVVEHGVG